jgi:predicted Zn-dependent protease
MAAISTKFLFTHSFLLPYKTERSYNGYKQGCQTETFENWTDVIMKYKLTLLILGSCFCLATNPITGQTQFMLFPESHDTRIGKTYAPEIEKQMGGRIEDQTLQTYIDNIGQKIARVSHYRNFEYHFTAVNSKTVNAFAMPGGYIFITKGMLKNLQTEAQLAAILAHETVHVVARHSSAAASAQIGTDILLSAVITDETSQHLTTVTELARSLIDLKYNRDDEYQSDLAGLDYMVAAGYDPYGMVETMAILEQQQKSVPIEFLSTHPSPQNRQDDIREKIQFKYPDVTSLKVGKENYRRSVLDKLPQQNK